MAGACGLATPSTPVRASQLSVALVLATGLPAEATTTRIPFSITTSIPIGMPMRRGRRPRFPQSRHSRG